MYKGGPSYSLGSTLLKDDEINPSYIWIDGCGWVDPNLWLTHHCAYDIPTPSPPFGRNNAPVGFPKSIEPHHCRPLVPKSEKNAKHETFHPLLLRMPTYQPRRKLLILDLNGLLVDIVFPSPKDHPADTKISNRAIFKRPYCLDFLNFCFKNFEVAIWSSRAKNRVDRIIDYLLGDLKHKLLFSWDLSYCTSTKFYTRDNRNKPLVLKELKRVWEKKEFEAAAGQCFDASNTLLLDDSPHKALLNPAYTAVFPHPFHFKDKDDRSLGGGGDLRVYLEHLALAHNVQEFVMHHPFGQPAITERNPSWKFYHRVISSLLV